MPFFSSLACHLRYALLILCFFLVIILFSKWTGVSHDKKTVIVENKQRDVVRDLMFKSQKLANMAAAQVEARQPNDVMSPEDHYRYSTTILMQLMYALAYVDCAQMLTDSNEELEKITGVKSVQALVDTIKTLQENALV